MSKTPTLTSAELLRQSEALRRQADELMRKEIPGVIARIKEAIAHYGLSADDLGLAVGGKSPKRPGRPAGKGAPAKVLKQGAKLKRPRAGAAVVKFRDDAGHSWTGFGPRPKWLKDALANGVAEDTLKV